MTCELKHGAIIEDTGLLYEPDGLIDLSDDAKDRLVELCNHPDYAGWDWAEAFLIAEGFYTSPAEVAD